MQDIFMLGICTNTVQRNYTTRLCKNESIYASVHALLTSRDYGYPVNMLTTHSWVKTYSNSRQHHPQVIPCIVHCRYQHSRCILPSHGNGVCNPQQLIFLFKSLFMITIKKISTYPSMVLCYGDLQITYGLPCDRLHSKRYQFMASWWWRW